MSHIHDKIDFTVGVFVVNDNAVLLRKHDKYGKWLHVGGHIELDEDPIEALHREVKEEIGLDITLLGRPFEAGQIDGEVDLLPPRFLNRHRISETHEHIDFIYFARSETREVIPENEGDEWKWLTKEELEASPDVTERIKMYALAALKAFEEEL